jgi:hypothetical protein
MLEGMSEQRGRLVRNILTGSGILGIVLFLLGMPGSYYLLAGSIAALFLGVTDFGRQCPLILSARHLVYRIRSKGKPPVLSAKPIGEFSEGDRRNNPS